LCKPRFYFIDERQRTRQIVARDVIGNVDQIALGRRGDTKSRPGESGVAGAQPGKHRAASVAGPAIDCLF
jgi:hypothetical protein